jgi:hypothetical protein
LPSTIWGGEDKEYSGEEEADRGNGEGSTRQREKRRKVEEEPVVTRSGAAASRVNGGEERLPWLMGMSSGVGSAKRRTWSGASASSSDESDLEFMDDDDDDDDDDDESEMEVMETGLWGARGFGGVGEPQLDLGEDAFMFETALRAETSLALKVDPSLSMEIVPIARTNRVVWREGPERRRRRLGVSAVDAEDGETSREDELKTLSE